MIESNHSLSSPALGYSKKLWVFQPGSSSPASRLFVFLDAEIYLTRVKAQDLISQLVDANPSQPAAAVFVSHGTEEQRFSESLFNEAFSRFLCQELPSFLRGLRVVSPTPETMLCGLSLTGLAAVMAALHHPGVYTQIAAQSGAFWPEEGRVLRELANLPSGQPLSFYFDVGSEETDREGEVMSQQEGVEAVRRLLEKKGYPVTTHVFHGGHSTQAWRQALPNLLDWAVSAGR